MADAVRKVEAGQFLATGNAPGAAPVVSAQSIKTSWVEPGIDTVEAKAKPRSARANRATLCPLAAPSRRRPRRQNRKDPWPPQIPPLPEPCRPFPEPRIPPIPQIPRR